MMKKQLIIGGASLVVLGHFTAQGAIVIESTSRATSGVVAPVAGVPGDPPIPAVPGTGYTLNHGFEVSSSDLLQGLTPTVNLGSGALGHGGTSTNVSVLTNGSFPAISRHNINNDNGLPTDGDPFPAGNFIAGGIAGGSGNQGQYGAASLTYTLVSASNISQIAVYSGWQDNGRDRQMFRVFLATSDDPLNFVELSGGDYGTTGVNYSSGVGAHSSPSASRTIIRMNDGGEYLREDVVAIRIDFGAVMHGWSGYAEIDVFGDAIPEPSVTMLGGLVGLALLRRRRAA